MDALRPAGCFDACSVSLSRNASSTGSSSARCACLAHSDSCRSESIWSISGRANPSLRPSAIALERTAASGDPARRALALSTQAVFAATRVSSAAISSRARFSSSPWASSRLMSVMALESMPDVTDSAAPTATFHSDASWRRAFTMSTSSTRTLNSDISSMSPCASDSVSLVDGRPREEVRRRRSECTRTIQRLQAATRLRNAVTSGACNRSASASRWRS
mmetsp:Transcript_15273/g.46546  ORF Transcript_15273/g.46546 Transcript_15273/m.46546 type:complete len:220 (+) Transcript_15273:4597-5256(+)